MLPVWGFPVYNTTIFYYICVRILIANLNVMNRFLLILVSVVMFSITATSRDTLSLNNDWKFVYGFEVKKNVWRRVDLPHTYNREDALFGKLDYYRGQTTYLKKLNIPESYKGKRLFIKFYGVNTVSNVFVNDKHVGEHRGGYTAFVYEITDRVNYGKDNTIRVRVSNALQLDIMPLVGDFNFYGGIYRNVDLIVTEKSNISLTDYASSGVYHTQSNVSEKLADVSTKILISNGDDVKNKYSVKLRITDGNSNVIEKTKKLKLKAGENSNVTIDYSIKNPHLWDGVNDPFIYKTEVTLLKDGKIIDKVTQPLGLRYFRVDANTGFYLNGKRMKLKGVCRHQDRSEYANALLPKHHEEDMEIIQEMGANSIRLSHYPHDPYFYDLLDKNGIVTWSEIPFIGPGGYRDKGFVDQPSFRKNGKQQLVEMIRQNYNRPGICFWGLFNELKMTGDNPVEYVRELDALAKQEDPSRITTAASFRDGEINTLTDLICWNKYYGWYGGTPAEMGKWADKKHAERPEFKIGVSEYGAGGSIYHHEDKLRKTNPGAYWHPEAWQAYYHEENWRAIECRDFMWGSYIWNLFDFGAVHRTEGDTKGRNDKGIVTFDRKTKKDAWWFYKANWRDDVPVLYIANRRNTERKAAKTNIKVYSNSKKVELFVNGVSKGEYRGDLSIFTWKKIVLKKGLNKIEVRSEFKGKTVTDSCEWRLK